jgi:1A family penicillin-binding protein
MANYSRGWKDTSVHSPYFQKITRRNFTPSRSKPPRKFWNTVKIIFGWIWLFLRWIFGRKGFAKKLILVLVAAFLLGFIFFGTIFAYYSFNLPDPNKLATRDVPESTKIFDRNGKPLYEIYGEAKRTLIKLDEVPKFVQEATIAVEDKNYYKHGGVSITGIIRSIIVDILSGKAKQGGSTITQQFVRNAVLTREKTFARKFKEIALSLQLERKYSKDEILQLYFNEIPYGSNAYGIHAASQTFFGKAPKDLTLAEAAYLAALPKAPTYYSPYGPHKDELDSRADTVLQLMYEQSYISKTQAQSAQKEKVEFRDIGTGIKAPHFVLYVQDLLAQKYGEISLQQGGLKVTTTLDLDLQTIAEEAVAKQIPLNEKNYDATNASLVALDPRTGQILAMVGSRDYFDKEYDGAVNVALRPRQPGSSFKPYVYATAFKQGMNPATMLIDVVTNFGEFGGKEYIPQDYDGKEHGPVSIRQALQGSLNIPAVKTMILVGVEEAIDTAEAMGITTLSDRSRYGPSLVLGGGEVKLLDHTSAYGVFAASGIRHEPVPILKIEDKEGNILEEYHDSPGEEVLNPQIAYQINQVLSDNEARTFIFGRNNRLTLPDRVVAAKTGTTQEYRDAWTIGYTPSLAAGVWVGNNDNSSMKTRADGSVVAAPIWNEFMRRALENKPPEEFPRPEGIIELAVDSFSGKLPTTYTPTTKNEIFASFNEPKEYDDVHREGGLTVLHSEKPDNPAWEEPVKKWAETHGFAYISPENNNISQNSNVEIKLSAPSQVNTLPWRIQTQIKTTDNSPVIELFLDNYFLADQPGKEFEYTSYSPRVEGLHRLTVQVRTSDNRVSSKTADIQFALNQNLLLIVPQDNEALKFPANLILESNTNLAPENVKFFGRSASGKEFPIAGPITKQGSGQIFHYTLNWSESQKPPSGSYALYGQIGKDTSNEITVKIP